MNLVLKSGHRVISIEFACTFLIACSGNPEQIIFFHDLLNISLIGNKLGIERSIQLKQQFTGVVEFFSDRLNPKYAFAFLIPLRYGLLSMSMNREVPININASYVCALGAKHTPKSNYFMLITELKR